MSMNSNVIAETLNQQTEIIVNSAIQKVQFDTTIEAKIVSQDKDNLNKYLVETDTLKFYAYTGDTIRNYKAGTRVQILVPNGDYGERKTIISAISDYDTESQEVNISANKFRDMVVDRTEILTRELSGDIEEGKYLNSIINFHYNPKYDYIGIKIYFEDAKFNELPEFQITLSSSNKDLFVFTQNDILGNLTSLSSSIPHSKLYEVVGESSYFDPGSNFYGLELTTSQDNSQIKLNKCELLFGYKKELLETQLIRLYTEAGDNPVYSIGSPKNSLYPVYYDGEQLYSYYSNNSTVGDRVKVLQYNIGYAAEEPIEKLIGGYWQIIGEAIPTDTQNKDKAKTSRYKAAVMLDENTVLESQVVIFTNQNYTQETATNIAEPVILSLDEGDNGIYNCYGLDGHILSDSTYNLNERHVTVTLVNGDPIESSDIIEWNCPTINTGLQKIDNEEQEQKGILTYKLKNVCYPSYTNNTVTCRVIKADGTEFAGSFSFEFGGAGHMGTEYSLNIDFCDSEGNITNKKYLTPGKLCYLKATFERIDGQPLDVEPEYKWSWYQNSRSSSEGTGFVVYNDITSGMIVTIDSNPDILDNDLVQYYSVIAQITVTYTINNGEEINITNYLPIPASALDNAYITGANRVVYNMSNDVSYDTTPYELYENGNERDDVAVMLNVTDLHDLKVKVKNETPYYSLSPADGALIGMQPKPVSVIFYDENNTIFWVQPILTIRDSWQLSNINQWTGQDVEMNKDKKYILTPMLAAGTKAKGNTFTGTMLGSVNNVYGLYGYQEGALRYLLDEKGRFYVGDGQNSYIKFNIDSDSSNVVDIKTKNFTLNANNIYIDSTGTFKIGTNNNFSFIYEQNKQIAPDPTQSPFTTPYLTINGYGEIAGWLLEKNLLVGRKKAEDENSHNGFEVALRCPTKYGYNQIETNVLTIKSLDHTGKFSEEDKVFFSLDSDGTLQATRGQIGGWQLGSSALKYTGYGNSATVIYDCWLTGFQIYILKYDKSDTTVYPYSFCFTTWVNIITNKTIGNEAEPMTFSEGQNKKKELDERFGIVNYTNIT